MREPYICPHCNHHSTRRWNLDVHINRKHGGYLQNHMPNNPPLYSKSVQTVADNVVDTFRPTFLPQEAVLGISQYSANPIYPHVDLSQTFANPMYRPMHIVDNPSNRTSLFQDNIVKIQELKRLMYKYPHYCASPDGTIKLPSRRPAERYLGC